MRVVLIHWRPDEAGDNLRALADAGIAVSGAIPGSASALRGLTDGADAVLIDLTRLPLQGRAVAIELRKRAESRHVPIVFMGGAPEKVKAVRHLLPDATYLEWDAVAESLQSAIDSAPKKPLVPDTMAGYSGTPLPKKLGIKAGSAVALIGAPEGLEAKLAPLPEGVKFLTKVKGADRILLFVTAMKDFRKRWSAVTGAADERATLWIAWPKKASGVPSDVTETLVRAHGLENGWVDYKICAIDETWSGLAFVRRRAAKAGR
jgi:hypothetical protein